LQTPYRDLVKSFALVVNPVSGKGAARRAAKVAARHLSACSASVNVYETEGRGDAARWVQENQEDYDAVVAVGGDGTLREVIEGIRGDRTVGLVPSGTANVVGARAG
jgi:diacylglycerol kinase family enzyme